MSYRDELWTTLCDSVEFLKIMLMLMILFGLLTLYSLVFGEPGTGPYALALINFAIAIVAIGGLIFLYWRCTQRPEAY